MWLPTPWCLGHRGFKGREERFHRTEEEFGDGAVNRQGSEEKDGESLVFRKGILIKTQNAWSRCVCAVKNRKGRALHQTDIENEVASKDTGGDHTM